jgi:predicted ester cyclase
MATVGEIMTDTVSDTSLRQAREAIVREHIDGENRHDPEATLATFSQARASYDIPAYGEAGQIPNHAAVRQLYVALFSAFPDFHVDIIFLKHGDDHILVEARFSGTQQQDWFGIPSTGRSFNTRVACLYEFEGDELVCERVYMDFAEFAAQLQGSTN